ncbi:DUF899 domain-containing protein [Pseudonocardia acaciae]|uniref:DUF899 domain-containing protein n=1 Tax=Pseudonocardia acaciae TaxID=551276 RepID=UPI000490DB96|nr:DUF899 domain-containing protein [Pseudonocardia acaciae]
MNLPDVVTREEWLAAREELLAEEKALTRHRDEVNARRRRLPMVEVDKDYVFEGPDGRAGLLDLFEGRRQLLVMHFMFDPSWDEGCPSCSLNMDGLPHLAHLHARDTSFAAVSRAPLPKLLAYRERMGWTFPWYSSHGSDFNYDFHTTLAPAVAPVEYNFMAPERLAAVMPAGDDWSMEVPGQSAFLRDGDRVFHTYTTYARGADALLGVYNWLDLTALGRQEDWERPTGRADGPAGHWLRRHDRYAT